MCIRPNGEDNGIHSCITGCPLCWIFLSASNKKKLANGQKIELGTAYELMLAVQEGCPFAGFWLEAVLGTEHGPVSPFSSLEETMRWIIGAWQIWIGEGWKWFESERSIRKDADGESRNTGDGAMEKVYHGHEDTFGVFAWDCSFSILAYTSALFSPQSTNSTVELPAKRKTGSETGETIKQRFAQPVVDQPRAYETAREWIAECLFLHADCPKPTLTSPLPTRVLDVSTLNVGDTKVSVFVSEGMCAQYAALSYCWGKTRQLTTTQESLVSFVEHGIEIARLPKTLQDAITVVRKLGIKYLWIDSLCIVQDSDDDKAREISKMPQIYKGAVITISAALAKDCDDGFLEHRQEMQQVLNYVFALEYFLPEEDGLGAEVLKDDTDTIFVCADADCGYKMKDFDKETINQRAWTLQESWLAPKMLVYGSGPLQWQCLSKSASFGGTPPDGDKEVLPVEERRKFFLEVDGELDRERLTGEWRELVRQYTRRAMTDPRDKLPALSGIAAEFARLSGDVYLAGLWKSSLPYGLLWHQVRAVDSSSVGGYRAPSWSWASLDGGIGIRNPRSWMAETEVVVESLEVTPLRDVAPMGEVVSGKLRLRGPVTRMSWEKVQERFVIVDLGESAHLYWDYIILDNGLKNPRFMNPKNNNQYAQPGEVVSVSVYPPARITPIPRVPVVRDVSDALGEMNIAEDGEYVFLEITRAPEPTGIVLEKLENGTYKRIGFFLMGRRVTSLDEQRDGFWSTGERDWDWDRGLDIRSLTIV